MHPPIERTRDAIADLCRLHGARSLEVFGSILRDDFDLERSDVDVLVEFEPQAAMRIMPMLKSRFPFITSLTHLADPSSGTRSARVKPC